MLLAQIGPCSCGIIGGLVTRHRDSQQGRVLRLKHRNPIDFNTRHPARTYVSRHTYMYMFPSQMTQTQLQTPPASPTPADAVSTRVGGCIRINRLNDAIAISFMSWTLIGATLCSLSSRHPASIKSVCSHKFAGRHMHAAVCEGTWYVYAKVLTPSYLQASGECRGDVSNSSAHTSWRRAYFI